MLLNDFSVERAARPHGFGRRGGFTLVELLVVIFIIGLLIGILLPSLAHARQVAARTKCASQLHQMMLAAVLHASSHHGFYPLAGVLPAAQGPGLLDADYSRYTYFSNVYQGYTRTLAPITTALAVQMKDAQQMGATVTNDQLATIERDPNSFIKYFTCPSQTTAVKSMDYVPLLYTGTVSSDDTVAPGPSNLGPTFLYTQFQSYVYNEYVVGFDDPTATNLPFPKLRGKADKVRQADRTMFAADGLEEKVNSAEGDISTYGMYTIFVKPTTRVRPPITLADAYDADANAGDTTNFDKVRHQGKIEIAFCDGHVETKSINDGDLQKVYIVPP